MAADSPRRVEFARFIAPQPVDAFLAEHFGKRPLHVEAAGNAPRIAFGWERLNALLAIRSHWTDANINLIMNSRAVDRAHYMDDIATLAGPVRRADAAKVEAFLAMGASMVGNAVEEIDPTVGAVVDMLADRFAARAGANLYCSFQGVQAFASHYDNHEVFAVQCEGEKVWRIYRNRADAPLDPVLGDEAAQQRIDAAKGAVLTEVRMRPGDLLYIPRGYFHDALASSAESLHLTFAVAPHSGRALFRLLEDVALRDSAFRRYLPDAREEDGAALSARIDALAEQVGAIMRSQAFFAEVESAQRELARGGHAAQLPRRSPVEAYARTDRPASVIRRAEGAALVLDGGSEHPIGHLAREAEWMLGRPAIVLVELLARYPHRREDELRGLVDLLARQQLLVSYQPGI